MAISSNICFFITLISLFLIEGLGIKYSRELTYFLALFTPFILFSLLWISKSPIKIPKQISIVFFLFFISSAISTFFALNIQSAFEYTIFCVSAYLFFLYGVNFREDKHKPLLALILLLGVIFCLYSVLISVTIPRHWLFFVPTSGFNFVYPTTQIHNHLGDYIVLCLIGTLFFPKKGRIFDRALLLTVFFTPFFIFSYSRSGYLSFIGVVITWLMYQFKRVSHEGINFKLPLALVGISLIFFFLVPNELTKIPGISLLRDFLVEERNLHYKTFLAERPEYFSQAWETIIHQPLTGVGLQNFILASKQYTNDFLIWSSTSHNVFLDMFAEGGIFTGLLFLVIIFLVVLRAKKNIFFFLFLALLINFQTNYSHRFYSFFILFFFLAGIIYKEKKLLIGRRVWVIVIGLSISIFLLGQWIFLGKIMTRAKLFNNALLYPLNRNAYEPSIEAAFNRGDIRQGFHYLRQYKRLFSGEPSVLIYTGEKYLSYGYSTQALQDWRKAYLMDPFSSNYLVKKIYTLENILYGKRAGRDFADSFFRNLPRKNGKIAPLGRLTPSFILFCWEVYKRCPYDFE